MADQPDRPARRPSPIAGPCRAACCPRRADLAHGALAVGMLLIIFLTGQPDGAGHRPAAGRGHAGADPDRVRDYQDRLRALDAQAALEATGGRRTSHRCRRRSTTTSQTPPPIDPLAAERRRRDYESLFASNVVLSRRPETPGQRRGRPPPAGRRRRRAGRTPSIDDIADAVVRATSRDSGAAAVAAARRRTVRDATAGARRPAAPAAPTNDADPISRRGPLHRVLEGTLIDAVLTNRLDGDAAAPVNCLVTNPVYSHSGQHVLIPAGARAPRRDTTGAGARRDTAGGRVPSRC